MRLTSITSRRMFCGGGVSASRSDAITHGHYWYGSTESDAVVRSNRYEAPDFITISADIKRNCNRPRPGEAHTAVLQGRSGQRRRPRHRLPPQAGGEGTDAFASLRCARLLPHGREDAGEFAGRQECGGHE